MAPKNKTGEKSSKKIREEILEDWADVRRWIDDLQQDWVNRHTRDEPEKKETQRSRQQTSSGK